MNTRKIITFLTIAIFSYSCSTTLKVKQLNEKTGQLPTDTKLTPEEILVNKNIDLKNYNQFLYVKNSGVNMEKYDNYVVETLRNIGGFQQIYTQSELEQFIIQNNLTDKITNISDNIGLLNLQKQVGNFLICESSPEFLGGYSYAFKFKIINPETAETLLEIKHKAINWGGVDRPLFNPVFNYYINWIKKNSQ